MISNLASKQKVVLAMGNFDGVHRGHAHLLSILLAKAETLNAIPIVVTFDPHPREILLGVKQSCLTTQDEKLELLQRQGINRILVIPFTRDLSNLSPRDFLAEYLFSKYDVCHFVLGHDFTFGSNRSGDITFMEKISVDMGFGVSVANPFEHQGKVVSSSRIRSELTEGEMDYVNEMLNRPYSISGIVIKGDGRGRTIGYPTANLAYPEEITIPKPGVYITTVDIDDLYFKSLTNIGHNPTFKKERKLSIETHILDFDSSIYGKKIKVNFKKRIRAEKHFNSVDELVKTIGADVENARKYFV